MDNYRYTFSERYAWIKWRNWLNKNGGHYKQKHFPGHMIIEVAGFTHNYLLKIQYGKS